MFSARQTNNLRQTITVIRQDCLACGACTAVCPQSSLNLINLTLTVDDLRCTRCGRCLKVCPVRALHMHKAG